MAQNLLDEQYIPLEEGLQNAFVLSSGKFGLKIFATLFRFTFIILIIIIGTGSLSVQAGWGIPDWFFNSRAYRVIRKQYPPTSPNAGSPIGSGSTDQIDPAVAYNSTNNGYLVVWEHEYSSTDYDIYAQRVDSTGVLTGSVILVATSYDSETNPSVAFNSDDDEYLVVWEYEYSSTDHDIYARRIISVGVMTGTQIYVTTLSKDETKPDVDYNPGSEEHLVVWERLEGADEFTHYDIYGQRLNRDGTLDGSSITIDSDSLDESSPSVTYWGGTWWQGYLVVWQDKQSTGEYDIHGQRIANSGSLVTDTIVISSWEYDQLKPRIACGSNCLVVWEDHHWGLGTDWDIYGQLLGVDGLQDLYIDGDNFAISWEGTQHRQNPEVSFRDATDEYLVAWEYEYSVSDHDIYYRRVEDDGDLLDNEVVVSELTSNEEHSVVAFGSECNFIIIWQDDRDSGTLGYDIYGDVFPLECSAHCDCPQGYFCYYCKCIQDPEMPVYCCDNPGCPPGKWCIDRNGTKSTCSEDPTFVCQTACDCGPAHCCNDNKCVKDINDPWLPGGTQVGPACVIGEDPTYCCSEPECFGATMAYSSTGIADLFRCYDLDSGSIRNYCGGGSCYGTACNCDSGESCVDTVENSPPGKTCFLNKGGTCVSNAVAEALFGFSSNELLPCSSGIPGMNSEIGWQTDSSYGVHAKDVRRFVLYLSSS